MSLSVRIRGLSSLDSSFCFNSESTDILAQKCYNGAQLWTVRGRRRSSSWVWRNAGKNWCKYKITAGTTHKTVRSKLKSKNKWKHQHAVVFKNGQRGCLFCSPTFYSFGFHIKNAFLSEVPPRLQHLQKKQICIPKESFWSKLASLPHRIDLIMEL